MSKKRSPSSRGDSDLPDVDLKVGEGDWLAQVLVCDDDRVVYGTRFLWNVAILAAFGSLAAAMILSVISSLILNFGELRGGAVFAVCGSPFLAFLAMVVVLLPLYHVRRQWIADRDSGTFTYARWCGLIRTVIPADKIQRIGIGWNESDDGDAGDRIAIGIFEKSRKQPSISWIGSYRDEDDSHLLPRVAIEAARRLGVSVLFAVDVQGASRPLKAVDRALRTGDTDFDWWSAGSTRFAHPILVFGVMGYDALVSAFIGLYSGIPMGFSTYAVGLVVVGGLILTGAVIFQNRRSYSEESGDSSSPMVAVKSLLCILMGVVIGIGYPLVIAPKLIRQGPQPFAGGGGGGPRRNVEAKPTDPSIREMTNSGGNIHVVTDYRDQDKFVLGLQWLEEHKDNPAFVRKILDDLSHGSARGPQKTVVRDAVLPYLKHPDPYCREYACNTLRENGGPELISVIEPLLDDPTERVREAADRFLDHYERRMGDNAPARVREILNADGGKGVRVEYRRRDKFDVIPGWLTQYKDSPAIVERILDDLKSARRAPEAKRTTVVQAVLPHLANPDSKCREYAIEVVRENGTRANIPAMQALLSDPVSSVRDQARRAIDQLMRQ